MTVAYIAGPYRSGTPNGIHENIQKARKVALKYWKLGYAVICPHLNTALMDGACPDDVWMTGDIEILKRCDVIVMMDGWRGSTGASREYAIAKENNITVIEDS